LKQGADKPKSACLINRVLSHENDFGFRNKVRLSQSREELLSTINVQIIKTMWLCAPTSSG